MRSGGRVGPQNWISQGGGLKKWMLFSSIIISFLTFLNLYLIVFSLYLAMPQNNKSRKGQGLGGGGKQVKKCE